MGILDFDKTPIKNHPKPLKKAYENKPGMEAFYFLKESVREGMSLSEIIDIFKEMSQIPTNCEEDWIEFETGTFTSQPMFYFTLERIFHHKDEKHHAICLEVMYMPNEENAKLDENQSSDDLLRFGEGKDILEYIKASKSFRCAQNEEIFQVNICMNSFWAE